jgi:hypothetical protein
VTLGRWLLAEGFPVAAPLADARLMSTNKQR